MTDITYFTMAPETGRNIDVETGLESASHSDYGENRSQLSAYQMKQLRRRIRSKELHYLDHPVLGMLLIITPYEKSEEDENINTAPKGYRTLSR